MRLHQALGDRPPEEFEVLHQTPIPGNRSVATLAPKPADRLYATRLRANAPATPNQHSHHLTTRGRFAGVHLLIEETN